MAAKKRAKRKKTTATARKSAAKPKKKAAKRSKAKAVKKKLEHRGYELEITEDREKPLARVAGKSITVTPVRKGKAVYATPFLPYHQSSSVEELAKAVVDHSAEFPTED